MKVVLRAWVEKIGRHAEKIGRHAGKIGRHAGKSEASLWLRSRRNISCREYVNYLERKLKLGIGSLTLTLRLSIDFCLISKKNGCGLLV